MTDLDQLVALEEQELLAKLQKARLAISHAGEKGSTLEHEVRDFIRSFLPGEYGVSSGFVIYHGENGVETSTQLDIIVYDAIRSGPLVRLESCDVFPLEAVYAYVEVKAQIRSSGDSATTLPSDSIESCLQKNRNLRQMVERRYWSVSNGSPIQLDLESRFGLRLRSFIFAFEATGTVASDAALFSERMATYSKRVGAPAHFHGVYLGGVGYFGTRAVDVRHAVESDYFHVAYTTDSPLRAFKLTMLNSLATFDRYPVSWTPAIGQYHLEDMSWQESKPEGTSQ